MNTEPRLERPICVGCRVAMRCERNGFVVSDPSTSGACATLWRGDKWKCPGCGVQIVEGFGTGTLLVDYPEEQREEAIIESMPFRHSLPLKRK